MAPEKFKRSLRRHHHRVAARHRRELRRQWVHAPQSQGSLLDLISREPTVQELRNAAEYEEELREIATQ